ncbi:MAG: cell division protein FtsH [Candidatus Harrisonbacteria bacterium CG10_big_fil_rev_8_21_14_0_10_42_17]|uniref:ATP-dependent zinc metalloprotease FtsH n=1 Tax=Candidatus Harrisonbacteria bacterium CG10_big_fil_rev_8_21_14_0_10_42_17 TaxID=1974584 RepID=A0A2M6WJ99_9BACT|nr:MAG: cell division protein FtsH [Candidatus Harrisonbacteria bacterium CG10_big_fil_rev_8_21_14_0_10_42_17]
MKLLYKNIFWVILMLFVLASLFSLLLETGEPPAIFSIGEVAQKIENGEITKIVVEGNKLSIDLRSGEKATARKESELGLSQTLSNYGVESSSLQSVAIEVKDESGTRFWLGVLIQTMLPIIFILVIFWFIFRQAKSGANQAFSFGRANLRPFTQFKDKVTFKDVAGLKESKEELEEIVDFLKNPKKFLDMGARIPRGVLLMGPPGTGKTLLARATAGEGGVPFFHISASEFVEMFVGVGASRTRDAFATAKKAAPSILFIDEIDAIGRERGAGLGGGHDEREQTLNQILVEMDGFDRESKVIVLAATNRPDVLDTALLRPGRFDRRVVLDLPDINDREAILRIHARNKPVAKDIDFRGIGIRTPGFSGADLANLLNEAAILVARENRKEIRQEDVLNSIEKVLLGPARKSRVTSEKEKKITAYHEAGHALVAASMKDSDPVHKITIVSRGRAGGYTLKLPTEEVRLRTKGQFLAEIATLMGGYTAEELTFEDISTGASNDLKEATSLSRKLVTKFGMSGLGPVTFGKAHENVFLGRELGMEKDYSEEVAAEIDREIRNFIKIGYDAAKEILSSKKKALEAIAIALMEKETLEKDEFYDILKPFKLKPATIQA